MIYTVSFALSDLSILHRIFPLRRSFYVSNRLIKLKWMNGGPDTHHQFGNVCNVKSAKKNQFCNKILYKLLDNFNKKFMTFIVFASRLLLINSISYEKFKRKYISITELSIFREWRWIPFKPSPTSPAPAHLTAVYKQCHSKVFCSFKHILLISASPFEITIYFNFIHCRIQKDVNGVQVK